MTPTLYWGSSTWRSIDPELSRIGFRLSFSRLGVLGTLFYLHIIYQSRPWITLYLMSGLLRCVARFQVPNRRATPYYPIHTSHSTLLWSHCFHAPKYGPKSRRWRGACKWFLTSSTFEWPSTGGMRMIPCTLRVGGLLSPLSIVREVTVSKNSLNWGPTGGAFLAHQSTTYTYSRKRETTRRRRVRAR